jgi:hypothetical protein
MPAVCPNIQVIAPFECIGDSLVKINENFYNLKTTVCDINPDVFTYTSDSIYLNFSSETRYLSADLVQSAVKSVHIDNGAVTNLKLAESSVNTNNIQDNAIVTSKIGQFAVTTDRISPLAITVNQLATNSVTTSKIVDRNVLYEKIQNVSIANRVLGSTIAGGVVQEVQVQTAMIADNAVSTNKLVDSAVTTVKLQDNSVTNFKIVNGSVNTDKLSDNAVTVVKIANNAVTADKIIASAVTTEKVNDNAITTNKLALESVTNEKIVAETITGSKLALNTITGNKIAPNTITPNLIARNSLTKEELATGAVDTDAIATGAVTPDKIADFVVLTNKIADNAVNTNKILENAVTASKIAANAVTTAKIIDAAVTTAKIADTAVTTAKIADTAVTTAKIADIAVTTNKVADTAVTTTKIADTAVTTAKIADTAVTTAKIADTAVTTAKIADIAVTTAKIADAAVTTNKLANNAVTNIILANNAVTQLKIADLSISTEKIADNAVTTAKVRAPVSGNYFDRVPIISNSGVMEIGKFIDFHNVANDTGDNTLRLENTAANQLTIYGSLKATTSISTDGNIVSVNAETNNLQLNHSVTTRENDTVFYTSANSADSVVRRNTKQGALESLGISEIISQLIPALANIRISLSNTQSVITNDVNDVGTIFIHPYQGNVISFYNPTTDRWDVKSLPGILSFNLTGLGANTNYDIYLYYEGAQFRIDFTPWSNSNRASTSLPKTVINGVKLKQGALNRRFIGCLRTTAAERTTINFGRRWVLGGSHPRFFLWNAQNHTSAAYSIYDGADWTVAGPGNGAANNNGPFSNFGYRNVNSQGLGNRVSFICDEPVVVEMHQDHYQSGTWAYLTHALDLEQIDAPRVHHIHRQGQFVSETQGQITHHSHFIVPAGYHYIQQLAMSYGGGTYAIYEGPVSGGDASFPGGRHSYGTTGKISEY